MKKIILIKNGARKIRRLKPIVRPIRNQYSKDAQAVQRLAKVMNLQSWRNNAK